MKDIRTFALGEVVVSVDALVAVEPVEVWFARTLSATDLTDLTLCSVDMTLARHTARVAIVTDITPATINGRH